MAQLLLTVVVLVSVAVSVAACTVVKPAAKASTVTSFTVFEVFMMISGYQLKCSPFTVI
jgi:hypothetical protein